MSAGKLMGRAVSRRRGWIALLLIWVLATLNPAGAATLSRQPEPIKVLLVGNSLVYFNDLPAHLEAIAGVAAQRPVRVTMLAAPGYRIEQHEQDGMVASLLASQPFDWLVLQEQGSMLGCWPPGSGMTFDCPASHQAHRRLAEMGRAAGVQVLMLGTYSNLAETQIALSRAEARLAEAISAKHASLVQSAACRTSYPYYRWFARDGMHPGPDLTAMMAIRILEIIAGPLQFDAPVQVQGHAFNLRISPRSTVPHRESDALPLVPLEQWAYAPEVLGNLNTCNAAQAAALTEACRDQVPCLGRDLVWVPTWLPELTWRH